MRLGKCVRMAGCLLLGVIPFVAPINQLPPVFAQSPSAGGVFRANDVVFVNRSSTDVVVALQIAPASNFQVQLVDNAGTSLAVVSIQPGQPTASFYALPCRSGGVIKLHPQSGQAVVTFSGMVPGL